jgi:hypothetical protein
MCSCMCSLVYHRPSGLVLRFSLFVKSGVSVVVITEVTSRA